LGLINDIEFDDIDVKFLKKLNMIDMYLAVLPNEYITSLCLKLLQNNTVINDFKYQHNIDDIMRKLKKI